MVSTAVMTKPEVEAERPEYCNDGTRAHYSTITVAGVEATYKCKKCNRAWKQETAPLYVVGDAPSDSFYTPRFDLKEEQETD